MNTLIKEASSDGVNQSSCSDSCVAFASSGRFSYVCKPKFLFVISETFGLRSGGLVDEVCKGPSVLRCGDLAEIRYSSVGSLVGMSMIKITLIAHI
jgi:hypothetical protein